MQDIYNCTSCTARYTARTWHAWVSAQSCPTLWDPHWAPLCMEFPRHSILWQRESWKTILNGPKGGKWLLEWFFLSSSFRKKEQELDGQKKVTCLLLPIDFPVPFSGSLVSRNYSSAFSGSLGWDISHCGGLTVPRSPRGRLERWLLDNTSVGALESECFIVDIILVVYYFLMTPVLAHIRLWDLKKLIYFCWNIDL